MGKAKIRSAPAVKDTASMDLRHVMFGGGLFDPASEEHQNQKGWEIFELGQRSFWAVPDVIPWDQPIREDPTYAEPIAAMLTFLCPGEKAAVTGASYISNMVKSEEAKFYFVEQALEEAKHFDVLRRLIPKITARPMPEPNPWMRVLYSFGVVDKNDVAFMIGSINIIGEHLANQIFHKINHVAKDPLVREVLAVIGKDESRHIGAGRRFFPEVFADYERNRHRIHAKNLATTIILSFAARELVGPMRTLNIDLAEVMDNMYRHYDEITSGLPAFPEQAVLDQLLELVRLSTRGTIRSIRQSTDGQGRFDPERFLHSCERALRSPRELRALFAA